MDMEVAVDIGPNTRMTTSRVGRTSSSRFVVVPSSWDAPVGTKLSIRLYSSDGGTKAEMIRRVCARGSSRIFVIPYRDAAWAEEGVMVHIVAEVMEDDDTGREVESGVEVAPADA